MNIVSIIKFNFKFEINCQINVVLTSYSNILFRNNDDWLVISSNLVSLILYIALLTHNICLYFLSLFLIWRIDLDFFNIKSSEKSFGCINIVYFLITYFTLNVIISIFITFFFNFNTFTIFMVFTLDEADLLY